MLGRSKKEGCPMAKAVNREKWKSHPCPRGCGNTWNWYVYRHRGGGLVATCWWTWKGKPFSFAPKENKPCHEIRVIQVEGKYDEEKFEIHPDYPAWKPTGHNQRKIQRCC